eukprot:TRINITY_DN16664_c0_g1_i2.p2 TRINITY_DN16664_c0_g1~~TRINITY_DN16664_c0_g1_i2.p2  ORF type:complete len:395 (+),score=54.55 TRINITY_DN16664_c0_g1_i2:1374-2558(+)
MYNGKSSWIGFMSHAKPALFLFLDYMLFPGFPAPHLWRLAALTDIPQGFDTLRWCSQGATLLYILWSITAWCWNRVRNHDATSFAADRRLLIRQVALCLERVAEDPAWSKNHAEIEFGIDFDMSAEGCACSNSDGARGIDCIEMTARSGSSTSASAEVSHETRAEESCFAFTHTSNPVLPPGSFSCASLEVTERSGAPVKASDCLGEERDEMDRERAVLGATRVTSSVQTDPLAITLRWQDHRISVRMLESRNGILAGRLAAPGGLYLDLGLIVLTSLTDLNMARMYLLGEFYQFAFLTLTISWYSTMHEVPAWLSLRREIEASLRQGYYTDALAKMRNTERSVEGVVDMLLAIYFLPLAVVSVSAFYQGLFSILISLRGIVVFLRERDRLRGY